MSSHKYCKSLSGNQFISLLKRKRERRKEKRMEEIVRKRKIGMKEENGVNEWIKEIKERNQSIIQAGMLNTMMDGLFCSLADDIH